MNKIFIVFLVLFYGTATNAQIGPDFRQVPKPILCGPVDVVMKALAEPDINERPQWLGVESNKTEFALFVNDKSGAFTLIQFTQNIACILGIGDKSKFLNLKPS